ncbi:peptidyl-prolyl cis-trans isomerase Pin1 [Coemansia sp. RSA 486]|nr:peptidyl-prolyl cis-trans isomerase Pin1 [Coemansia sp. RSA 486]
MVGGAADNAIPQKLLDRWMPRMDYCTNSALPPNWVVRLSKSRNINYYFNKVTGESQWDAPTSSDDRRESEPQHGQKLKMRARHILAKHVRSRRPSSWREENITRTEEEAREKILAIREAIVNGSQKFEDVAAVESDCSSAKRGGDLGWFDEGAMQPAFEKAVKALKVGEISMLVESDSGVHIIERMG